jgi:hypothetical protein
MPKGYIRVFEFSRQIYKLVIVNKYKRCDHFQVAVKFSKEVQNKTKYKLTTKKTKSGENGNHYAILIEFFLRKIFDFNCPRINQIKDPTFFRSGSSQDSCNFSKSLRNLLFFGIRRKQ